MVRFEATRSELGLHCGPPWESCWMNDERSRIEIGWVIAGQLDEADYQAVKEAHDQLTTVLSDWFPEFSWHMPMVRRPELVTGAREEPVVLLDRGRDERATHHWDFALVVTQADFITHYKPFAVAIVSRGLDLGLISTSRIDPASYDEDVAHDVRIKDMGGRIESLALHVLGHLAGLHHVEHTDNIMLDLRDVSELDHMNGIRENQKATLGNWLRQIADTRLEEVEGTPATWLGFYVRSAVLNRHEVYDAVWQARPWEYPRRLGRLTTAAVSAITVFMLTAEAWDFAISQSAKMTVMLSLVAIAMTTMFISRRQQLFVRRHRRGLSEQRVVANVSTACIVLCGMVTTYVLMFAAILLTGSLLFPEDLVVAWSHSHEVATWSDYLRFSGIAASLGLVIGALGASFEEQHHFRHVTFVDEET